MIIATLCTTNGREPWAANVPFEVRGDEWKTVLKTKYAHFQNLKNNSTAVIVYKESNVELIMKAKALLDGPNNEGSKEIIFTIQWLRLIEGDSMLDTEDRVQIIEKINQKLRGEGFYP